MEQTLSERIAAERIEKTLAQPFNVRQLAKKPERLRFDLTIQRNLRWTHEQKSALIESILLGYPIPPVYTLKSEDNSFWLLDGKQRLSTLISFRNDGFELSELPEVYGVDITGMKFSDLPEEFQELIEEQNITFYQFERLTTDQRDELFKRLNSGTPLSAIELTRSILGTEMLDYINSLIDTPFIKKVGVTDKQREKFTDQELILQMIAVITGREKNMSGKAMRDFALSLRLNGLTEDEKTAITETFQYLSDAFANVDEKTSKKVLKKADIIGITGAATTSKQDPETFGNAVSEFIANQKSGSAYKGTSSSGSAKPENVQKRIDILTSIVQEAKEAVNA
jgi:hypothetical protein